MIDSSRLNEVTGCTVYDSSGAKIGKAGQVYLDDVTNEPTWVSVNTGLFGTSESLVPIADADLTDDGLTVGYSKDQVKDAPNINADQHLSPEEERELYSYYGMDYAMSSDRGREYGDAERAGRTGDDAMTRSEERVEVGTQQREAGRARLRKYVVTENVTQTVPVRREEAVLEREPITDGNVGDATSGPDISEDDHEVVLHEERPVVQKTVEPVERVRLGTQEVQDEETVSEEVRKERIEAEGDVADAGRERGLDSSDTTYER
jgi:uncharacterized protein (TIGR02271 family)